MPDTEAPQIAPSASAHPGPHFPVLFADGVQSAFWGRGIVKFYLARSEPAFTAQGPALEQPFVQVVMPYDGLIAAAVFFHQIVERLIADKAITEPQIEAYRSASVQQSGV
jgi:hypothetical protein